MGFGANIILCWRCEEPECNRYFDFTQHTAEQCDGKCWKSYDIVEAKTKEERELAIGLLNFLDSLKLINLFNLKIIETPASRRCFTSDELMKANAIGINTANGCRDIKMREKVKHFCFCDGDMCNSANKNNNSKSFLIKFSFLLFVFILFTFKY